MDTQMYDNLKKEAALARINSIKTQMEVGSGHLGGAFSAMEIMTYLFFEEMDIDVHNPLREERDIFILSKGHASIGYYSLHKLQLDGTVEEVIPLGSLVDKAETFGLKPVEIDGHDFAQIDRSFEKFDKGEINVIVAHTIKGKGCFSKRCFRQRTSKYREGKS